MGKWGLAIAPEKCTNLDSIFDTIESVLLGRGWNIVCYCIQMTIGVGMNG